MQQERPNKLLINDVVLDNHSLRVKVQGDWRPIEVKQLALLYLLIDNIGQAVTRDTIITTLWPDTIVSDNSVSQLVVQLRKTLGDSKNKPRFIKTVPRLGYQLIADVNNVPDLTKTLLTPQINRPIYWLISGLVIGMGAIQLLNSRLFESKKVEQYIYQSRLSASPGAEVFLRYSPNGRYLAFSHVGKDQEQFDLSVIDMKTQSMHNLKSTGYSEVAPVWSADGKWLAYYRYDPFGCSVRVFSVDNAIEMWRLSPETTLFECDPAQGPLPIFWPTNEAIYTQHWKESGIQINHHHLSKTAGISIYKTTPLTNNIGLLKDIHIETGEFLFSNLINGKHHLINGKHNLIKGIKGAKGVTERVLNRNVHGPAAWNKATGSYVFGEHELKIVNERGHEQVIYQPNGIITDITVDFKGGNIAHAEGEAQVSLYHLDTTSENIIEDLSAVSSAAKLDIMAEVSQDGNWFAFASYDPQHRLDHTQVEIWIKHRQRDSVSLLTMLPNHVFPKQLLLSPQGDNLLIVSEVGTVYLINLFSKKLIKIIQDFKELRNIYWSDDGNSINYQVKHSADQWQLWQYSLHELNNSLVERDQNKLENYNPVLASQNMSFPNFLTDISTYLLTRTSDEIDPEQLQASLRLYTPALFKEGIYYILRQGHQLYLYCYYSERQENIRIGQIGLYLYDINVPLSLSTDGLGVNILLNRVDGIETDIVLHKSNSVRQ
jgi:DNA-binding winged helix-turn-helix (wHTH) protein